MRMRIYQTCLRVAFRWRPWLVPRFSPSWLFGWRDIAAEMRRASPITWHVWRKREDG